MYLSRCEYGLLLPLNYQTIFKMYETTPRDNASYLFLILRTQKSHLLTVFTYVYYMFCMLNFEYKLALYLMTIVSFVSKVPKTTLKFIINTVVRIQEAPPCCKRDHVNSLIGYRLYYSPCN